ncbi:hypothetical protein AX15_004508 [Amanita polypyramis BW_CC]|nr:hypothetical protein AX15_004508 [Amanita polypyramis BW_CC]
MAASAILSLPITPPDYFNVVSPSLFVPSDPQAAIPVGLLACQRDPLLKRLETTIVGCVLHQPPANAKDTKKAKKSVIAPKLPSDPLLEIILHDTVIFPEGGGQPTDTGIITTVDDDDTEWEVVQSKRQGSHAVHYVRVPDGNVGVATSVLFPGAKVIVSLGQEGWTRRYDHMSMHTSQHLLSALLETRLNLPTLSWSLTSYPSPCYIEVPRGLSKDETMSIQEEANVLVFEGRRVRVEVEELDEVQEQSKEQVKLESGRAIGRGMPDDYTGGVKRIVVIDGVDRNPCCGTHLPSIHNLQLFLLPHTEALSRSRTTSARLYFLSGPRLVAHLTSTHNLLTSTASTLSCGAPSVPERVTQVVEERKQAEKRVSDLESELAKVIANELVHDMDKPSNDAVYKKHIHRVDDTMNALGFLNAVSLAFLDKVSLSRIPYLFVLSSSPSLQTPSTTNVILVFGSDDKSVRDAGEGLKSKLGVKGGGKGSRWSGKLRGVWKQGRENTLIEGVLSSL